MPAKKVNLFKLKDFLGVDPEHIARLNAQGIRTTLQIQSAGRTPEARRLLAEKAGFPHDWESRLKRLLQGLVVYHSGRCPNNAMFVTSLLNAANAMSLPAQAVELKSCREARQLSPSAFGTFGVVYNSRLLSYRPMGGKTSREMLEVQ